MLKALRLSVCFCVLWQIRTFDHRLITAVRNGIERNLKYIKQNFEKMNEDCWFGVILATAILEDAYQNGTQVMDNSSLRLLKMISQVLKQRVSSDQHKTWNKYILDPSIWQRKIKYKYDALDPLKRQPNSRVLENVYRYQNISEEYPSSDFCLQNVIHLTMSLTPVRCHINKDCRKKYYKAASAYILTHKLLLLQLARGRKCIISVKEYEAQTKKLCSLIFSEVISADYYDVLDEMFDLFLEEVLLCGYEGYADFFETRWLIYILKSQKETGCFSAFLGDHLKTRIKRNTNILPDGCADHTTGLGTAVLSLYYNFIIKGNISAIN